MGWPRDRLRCQSIQHSGKWDRFTDMFESADPGDGALDAHTEAGMRNRSEPAQVQIPFEDFFWEAMLLDPLGE